MCHLSPLEAKLEDYNFEFDGVRYKFAESSLCFLTPDNTLRKGVAQIAVTPPPPSDPPHHTHIYISLYISHIYDGYSYSSSVRSRR